MHKKAQKKPKPLTYPLGDAIDRLTILTRKIFFGEEDAYKELIDIQQGLNHHGYHGELIVACIRLAQMNFEIWNLENELRKGGTEYIDKVGFEEIGRRAVQIRDYNKKRVRYKNDINKMTGVGFTEFKIRHRAQ